MSAEETEKLILPTTSTGGPSFGLIPEADGPTVDVRYKRLFYGNISNKVKPDPEIANSVLFGSKLQYTLHSIFPLETGFYRVDWFCTLKLNIDLSNVEENVDADPFTHVTTEVHTFWRPSPTAKPINTVVGAIYNTFKPSSLTDESIRMSRVVRLKKESNVAICLRVRQSGTSVRLWQKGRTDYQDIGSNLDVDKSEPAPQTGFYLTKLSD